MEVKFKDIKTANFQKMMKDIKPQIQEYQPSLSKINTKKINHRHITVTLKFKDKEKAYNKSELIPLLFRVYKT